MSKEHLGESFIFSSAIVWGFFPIVTVLSYGSVPSMVSLTVSTIFASLPFLVVILYRKRFHELKNLLFWRYIFLITVFNSVLFYSLYYFGLTKTSPGNASIIALFEVCTSYVFFHIIRKEHFSFESKIGTALMAFGAFIVLIPNFSSFNFGDLFILLATFCAPMGNFFQQKARQISSTETILFFRSIIALPFLFLFAYLLGQHFQATEIKESLWFLILNGVFILGLSKVFWVEGISRIPVTKANALFTLFIAWMVLNQTPTIWQVSSLIPFFFGVLLLTNNIKLKHNYGAAD